MSSWFSLSFNYSGVKQTARQLWEYVSFTNAHSGESLGPGVFCGQKQPLKAAAAAAKPQGKVTEGRDGDADTLEDKREPLWI